MRFLFSILSLVALTMTPSLVSSSMVLDTPHYATLNHAHDYHRGYKILTDTIDEAEPEPVPVPVKEEAVIRQTSFSPIATLDIVVENSGSIDGTVPAWTVSIDASQGLYHFACTTGGEDADTRVLANGDVVNSAQVTRFVDEFSNYDHPRNIPRTQCLWTGTQARYRTQTHIRYDGKRSGNIHCTPTPLVQYATEMAAAAGCITN